jgi:hypothetical protein
MPQDDRRQTVPVYNLQLISDVLGIESIKSVYGDVGCVHDASPFLRSEFSEQKTGFRDLRETIELISKHNLT